LEQIENKVYIQEVIPNSPAEVNEIMPGDIIYRVDETPVVDVADAVLRIRGDVGTSVNLILYRGNLRLDKTVVRENVTDEKTIICK
jgi:carboxyl-terminal processing protease